MLDNCLTNSLRSKVENQIIYLPMKEENITVREFLRNYKKNKGKNKILIIQNNGKPEGVFVPYDKWKKEPKFVSLAEVMKNYEIDDNEDSDISMKIDEIVYGAPNPHRDDND